MRLQLAIVLVALAATRAAAQAPGETPYVAPPVAEATPPIDPPEPVTGTTRIGLYHDTDNTDVIRFLGVAAKTFGNWSANASVGVDAVTSASVDVRASPALSKVDVITGASGRTSTSGGEMTDTRYQLTAGAGWKDTSGHAVTVTGAFATEADYTSVSGGVNGSYDIDDRNATLLGGVSVTDNWVSSVLDRTHGKMVAVASTAGWARVLGRDDAIRVRLDGKFSAGDQASPYRNVRFGNWRATLGDQQIMFTDTIGSPDGLPERVPQQRLAGAAVVEWVHSLWPGVGLHPEVRFGHDSWSVSSLTAAIDLRIAREKWRLRVGYRFYLQSSAEFYRDQYTDAPEAYTYYTSDKELGEQIGHVGSLEISRVLSESTGPGDRRLLLTFQYDVMHYRYPGYIFLATRDSNFASLGLLWEL